MFLEYLLRSFSNICLDISFSRDFAEMLAQGFLGTPRGRSCFSAVGVGKARLATRRSVISSRVQRPERSHGPALALQCHTRQTSGRPERPCRSRARAGRPRSSGAAVRGWARWVAWVLREAPSRRSARAAKHRLEKRVAMQLGVEHRHDDSQGANMAATTRATQLRRQAIAACSTQRRCRTRGGWFPTSTGRAIVALPPPNVVFA
jgi:hypothetical protein